MNPPIERPEQLHPRPGGGDGFSRRKALQAGALSAAAAAGGLLSAGSAPAQEKRQPDARRASPKRYGKMKKSINQWAFPYPERMDMRECLQLAKDAGFDGIELNYDLENDLSI